MQHTYTWGHRHSPTPLTSLPFPSPPSLPLYLFSPSVSPHIFPSLTNHYSPYPFPSLTHLLPFPLHPSLFLTYPFPHFLFLSLPASSFFPLRHIQYISLPLSSSCFPLILFYFVLLYCSFPSTSISPFFHLLSFSPSLSLFHLTSTYSSFLLLVFFISSSLSPLLPPLPFPPTHTNKLTHKHTHILLWLR